MSPPVEPVTGRLLATRGRILLAGIALLSGALLLRGFADAPTRTWSAFLFNGFYVLGLSVTGTLFIAIHYLARAGWPTVFRRIPEAMTGYLPVGALAFLGTLGGIHALYHWSHPEAVQADPVLAAKRAWLEPTGFGIRMAVCLLLWILLSWRIVRNSREQDASRDPALTRRNVRLSAIFTILFALTFSVGAIDWLMSLEPHWYSTLYPWYIFSSILAGGTALLTLLVLAARRAGLLPAVGEAHIHDLGTYVFAFSFFWGYLWLSQYLLIWYADIPEEVTHYLTRYENGWFPWFLANPLLNACLPFLLLLPASWKKREGWLAFVCLIVLAGHWFDLYLAVVPPFEPAGPAIRIGDPAAFGLFGAIFLLAFDWTLGRAPIVPVGDPYLEESLHHHA